MKEMRNIRIQVAYDGTNYHGYQKQPGLKTIEGILKDAIENTVKSSVRLVSAGRTDGGVHAFGQVANFYSETTIDLGNLPRVINYHLPDDISVLRAEVVPMNFHSRFDAKEKTYRYLIYNGRYRNPIYHNRACFVRHPIDVQRMEKALQMLPGLRDYGAFMGKYAVVKDTIRRLDSIQVKQSGELIIVEFRGKSFLKNMIRIIMGTAIEVGRHLRDPEDFGRALATKKRKYVGPTAPAAGLYLLEVKY